ncbi:MAG: hypothetical protein KJ000_35640 [Pirellulaceae bacterium]|nr:hypothetical protein [Pirellulaceae bacterium]
MLILGAAQVAASLTANADDSRTVKNISRRVKRDGPGDTGARTSDVVQALDSKGDPRGYFMDVDSVICADAKCEMVTVRIHFDLLGDYERYELPSGGNLTKSGHKPSSAADHAKLHQILSDPYSQLKSVGGDQITIPSNSATPGDGDDRISGATALSKRNMVVVGAAYSRHAVGLSRPDQWVARASGQLLRSPLAPEPSGAGDFALRESLQRSDVAA